MTAEEFPLGVATATLYATQSASNNPINRAAVADPVNMPIIFEPPSALVGATAQVWIAASGGAGGVADPNWGGCFVWLSCNGTSYIQIGTIARSDSAGRAHGIACLLSRDQSRRADTLAVNIAESGVVRSQPQAISTRNSPIRCASSIR